MGISGSSFALSSSGCDDASSVPLARLWRLIFWAASYAPHQHRGLPYRNYTLKPAMDGSAASAEESQAILLRLLSRASSQKRVLRAGVGDCPHEA